MEWARQRKLRARNLTHPLWMCASAAVEREPSVSVSLCCETLIACPENLLLVYFITLKGLYSYINIYIYYLLLQGTFFRGPSKRPFRNMHKWTFLRLFLPRKVIFPCKVKGKKLPEKTLSRLAWYSPGPKVTEPNLRFSVVSWALQMLGISRRRGESAKICGFLRKAAFWALSVTLLSAPKRLQFKFLTD